MFRMKPLRFLLPAGLYAGLVSAAPLGLPPCRYRRTIHRHPPRSRSVTNCSTTPVSAAPARSVAPPVMNRRRPSPTARCGCPKASTSSPEPAMRPPWSMPPICIRCSGTDASRTWKGSPVNRCQIQREFHLRLYFRFAYPADQGQPVRAQFRSWPDACRGESESHGPPAGSAVLQLRSQGGGTSWC